MICQSCKSWFHGRYCNHCGLPGKPERITLKHLAEEAVYTLTSLHQKGLKTISTSFSRPELVARQYLAGIRTSYYNPVNFYFITLAFCTFFVYNYELNGPGIRAGETSVLSNEWLLVNGFIYEHFTLFFTLVIPVFSLFSFLSFRKAGYNYAEHLTLNVIYFGAGNIIFLLLTPVLLLLGKQHWQSGIQLYNFFWVAYLVFAYTRLFPGNKIKAVLSCVLFYSASLLMIAAIAWGCARLWGN